MARGRDRASRRTERLAPRSAPRKPRCEPRRPCGAGGAAEAVFQPRFLGKELVGVRLNFHGQAAEPPLATGKVRDWVVQLAASNRHHAVRARDRTAAVPRTSRPRKYDTIRNFPCSGPNIAAGECNCESDEICSDIWSAFYGIHVGCNVRIITPLDFNKKVDEARQPTTIGRNFERCI